MIFGKKNDKDKREGENMTDDNELLEKAVPDADDPNDAGQVAEVLSPEQMELEEYKKKNNELLDRLQRSMAEFDNYRKRTIKEKAVAYDDGMRDMIEKLLPVIDNLERALSSVGEKDNALYKGVEMIQRQLGDIMADAGLEGIKSVGDKFNPNLHNAVVHIEDDAYGENEIVQELLRGYKINDKVIRPAMVKVAN